MMKVTLSSICSKPYNQPINNQGNIMSTNQESIMAIFYSNKIKSYVVVDSKGAVLFRSWTEGVCQDYINDNQR